MGKYMRKAKTAGEVTVMEVTQSSLGVRTRAKTLALQKATAAAGTGGSGSYLQLRSRRLEKPAVGVNESSSRLGKKNSNGNSRARGKKRGSSKTNGKVVVEEKKVIAVVEEEEEDNDKDLDIEASFGENVLNSEAKERGTRETTPCSLIRDPDIIRTPGSSNRPTSSMQNREAQSAVWRLIPTAREMDKFFADTEEEQQRKFIEKYNYDPVNDKPLPGRFEWQKVNP